jgi:hypothetical protein
MHSFHRRPAAYNLHCQDGLTFGHWDCKWIANQQTPSVTRVITSATHAQGIKERRKKYSQRACVILPNYLTPLICLSHFSEHSRSKPCICDRPKSTEQVMVVTSLPTKPPLCLASTQSFTEKLDRPVPTLTSFALYRHSISSALRNAPARNTSMGGNAGYITSHTSHAHGSSEYVTSAYSVRSRAKASQPDKWRHSRSNTGYFSRLFLQQVHKLSRVSCTFILTGLNRSALEIAQRRLVSTKKRTVSPSRSTPSTITSLAEMSPVTAAEFSSNPAARSNDHVEKHFRPAAVLGV